MDVNDSSLRHSGEGLDETVRCQYEKIQEGTRLCLGLPKEPPLYRCLYCGEIAEGKIISEEDQTWAEPYNVCQARSRRFQEKRQRAHSEHPTGRLVYDEPDEKEMGEWSPELRQQ